jgi:4'-phosphopantetheinyl transferase
MSDDGCDRGVASPVVRGPALEDWQPGGDAAALGREEVRVWLVELDHGVGPEEVDRAEPGPELVTLSDDERARAARFVRVRDRRRFARCRAALRQILGDILGSPPAALAFRAVAKGKPELDLPVAGGDRPGAGVALQFNVSHSSDLALIAVSWGLELGVDIEHLRQITEAERIVASFFTPAELTEFATVAPEAKAMAFLRGWTRKEAILKGLGIGITGLAAEYETGFGTTELAPSFTPAKPRSQVNEWQLWEAAPRAEFVAALAVKLPAAGETP